MYNPKSSKAHEFICHDEVLESLEYAQKNKNNIELRYLVSCLNEIELCIRECDDIDVLKRYIDKLDIICNKIEGIINE